MSFLSKNVAQSPAFGCALEEENKNIYKKKTKPGSVTLLEPYKEHY